MQDNGLSQRAIADAAGVSQATVSRALARDTQRHGRAVARLCKYMQQTLNAESGTDTKGRRKVVDAFVAIWDGSEEHAIAIARIIKASQGLRPAEGFKGGR